MDAAAFCGSGQLLARLGDFHAEQLVDAASLASLSDSDLMCVNGQPLTDAQLGAFHLRALLFSLRPELLASKGDVFEDNWSSLELLKAEAVENWDNVKARMRNDLSLSLGDINGLRQRLNPAAELVAYPPVDIKLDGDEDSGRAPKAPKQRRKKDRNAPKRPRNAYLVFLDRHRPAKQAANPTAAMKDLTREMAKEWQQATTEEKKLCEDIAAQNKIDYEVAVKEYQAQLKAAGLGAPAAADGGDEVGM